MKQFMKAAICAVLPLLVLMNCQNTSESTGNDTGGGQTTPANTMTFKLNGTVVTMSGIAFTKKPTESMIGKENEGSYIHIPGAADLTSGNFDANSNPEYSLQYSAGGGVFYSSGGNNTNTTFTVSVNATEITGTFSGTVVRTEGQNQTTVNVTDGSFRVNK
jgi:hypothetical protein